MEYYCKECKRQIPEDELLTGRDGDPYSSGTKFWDVCPYCLEPLKED